ncbi:MAG: 6-bladed beta-propeller [Nitrosomonadales bacterium]|nr:MAG: 6-bladed beta-propeller [Nitrosomonadales bacterium]
MLQPAVKIILAMGAALLLAAAPIRADETPTEPAPQAREQSAAATDLVWPSPPLQPRIRYLGSVASPEDIGRKKGFWRKVWEFIRGEEEDEQVARPMAVALDGRDRLLVADTRRGRVHIFDRRSGEYSHLRGSGMQSMRLPIGLAVDGGDNVYVADGELNQIFVFRPDGEFDRLLDTAAWLKRPTALAIDRARQRLYVVDTPAHDVKVVDLATGKVQSVIGQRGEERGEFNFPTYVALDRQGRLAVTDSMNMRIQIFDTEGKLVSAFGKHGDGSGDFSAPKGVALDSEGHVYVADAGFDNVQVFDERGKLLLFWGTSGQEAGKFWLPAGLLIDAQDRIYVADSYNKRVQIFQYLGDGDAK